MKVTLIESNTYSYPCVKSSVIKLPTNLKSNQAKYLFATRAFHKKRDKLQSAYDVNDKKFDVTNFDH